MTHIPLTLEQALKGPDKVSRAIAYKADYSEAIEHSLVDTLRRVNAVCVIYTAETGETVDEVRSGWRPPAVNDKTANAAHASRHLFGDALDLANRASGSGEKFALWCFNNQHVLESNGLWMEHPASTVLAAKENGQRPWAHLQRTPSLSGQRAFFANASHIALWDLYLGDKA